MTDSDENYKPEVFYEALNHIYKTDQYDEFLWGLIEEIPLISLWDSCIGFARVLAYSGSVPECVKNVDLDALYELSEPNFSDSELLEPIQQWLSDQLIKSICNEEIESYLIGRFADGKIDPKRTFVDSTHIKEWLVCRGINIEDDSGYELFTIEAATYAEIIYNAILRASQLLISKAYDPHFTIPTNHEGRENDYLLFENTRLRQIINQSSGRFQPQKKTHANVERFAKGREQVLGAAVSVMAKWPELCRNKSNKIEATKIRELIDQKGKLFWRDTGQPPFSAEGIERLIREWINKTGE